MRGSGRITFKRVHKFWIITVEYAQAILLILIFLAILVILYGWYCKDLSLIQAVLITLLGGFVASYGASYFLSTSLGVDELDERYEGYPFLAEKVKLNLTVRNAIEKDDGYLVFGINIHETKEGMVVSPKITEIGFIDTYHFDLEDCSCSPQSFKNAVVSIGNLSFKPISDRKCDNNICECISVTERWVRLDIRIPGNTLQDINVGTRVRTEVSRESLSGFKLLQRGDHNMPFFKFNYLVTVPTKKIVFNVELSEFHKNFNLSPLKENIYVRSSHVQSLN